MATINELQAEADRLCSKLQIRSPIVVVSLLTMERMIGRPAGIPKQGYLLGKCAARERVIYVNVIRNDFPMETLRHELAHLYQADKMGYTKHDRHWRAIARRLGVEPRAKRRF